VCGVPLTVGGAEPDAGSFLLLADGAWVDGAGLPAHQGGGLCWRRLPAGPLTGLDHLEGREVSVLLDGALQEPRRVQGGAVALPRAAWKVHAGVCPGDDVADKYERLLPHAAPVRAGTAPPLLDGDREVRLASGYDRDGLFTIRQDDPLPMTVVCCVPQVQGEG
jgi:hypothetical protein